MTNVIVAAPAETAPETLNRPSFIHRLKAWIIADWHRSALPANAEQSRYESQLLWDHGITRGEVSRMVDRLGR